MKHARKDYDDRIICVKSRTRILELLDGLITSDNPHDRDRAQEIRDNILGGHIPEDEPVFLTRGRDPFAAHSVKQWAYKAGSQKTTGNPTAIADMCTAALKHSEAMEAWPIKRMPDMPKQEG